MRNVIAEIESCTSNWHRALFISWSPYQTSLWKIYCDSDDTRARKESIVGLNKSYDNLPMCQRRHYVSDRLLLFCLIFFFGVYRGFLCCYCEEESPPLSWVISRWTLNWVTTTTLIIVSDFLLWVSLDHDSAVSTRIVRITRECLWQQLANFKFKYSILSDNEWERWELLRFSDHQDHTRDYRFIRRVVRALSHHSMSFVQIWSKNSHLKRLKRAGQENWKTFHRKSNNSTCAKYEMIIFLRFKSAIGISFKCSDLDSRTFWLHDVDYD